MVRLETVLDSWKTIRDDTTRAVEDFAGQDLAFRPSPDMMTFREIACHILDASHALTGLLIEGDRDLATPDFRAKMMARTFPLPADADAPMIATALRSAFERRLVELKELPHSFAAELMTRFDGQRVTCLEMLQGIKEHELSHRSQLFVYLRLKGLTPPTTRRRLAKAKA